MFACDYAVRTEPTNGAYLDSRGVARVLTGNFAGAVEDFQAFVDGVNRAGDDGNSVRQDEKAQRERWIAKLQMGENPLTPDELKTLESQ